LIEKIANKMKYLTLILAVVFFSCTTDSSQNTDTANNDAVVEVADESSETASTTEVAEEVTPAVPEPVIIRETVVVNESDIKQNEAVKAAFLNLVEAVNNATSADAENIIALLDEEYAFKGRDLEANSARLTQQLGKFDTENTDVEIQGIHSSCDLAYVIASFKRTMTERATGEVKVVSRDKVGLFIMRKNSAGEWKLLVQKTDDGFAHWFYMPKES
jgi:ketosteroid isomerase-like protein